MKLKKIISGGQDGADRAGLEIAKELGYETGGTMPKGCRTAKGSDPSLKDFGLVEHSSPYYPPRTIENVKNADGTVWFGRKNSPGGIETFRAIAHFEKPWIANPTPQTLREFLDEYDIETLNVAGNRETTNPGIGERVKDTLRKALYDHQRSARLVEDPAATPR